MAFTLASVVLLAAVLGAPAEPAVLHASDQQAVSEADRRIWPEFVSLLRDGKVGEQHLRSAYTPNATLLEFLSSMRSGASWPEWEQRPEVYRVGELVHFVVRLSERGTPGTYSFTFLTENGRWFLQHFESIVLRLDRVGPLPVTSFPDIADDKKEWIREEHYWSKMVYFFRLVRKAAGDEAAFNMFRDGAGYAVSAKTWIPFVPPSRAFVLFACFDQSRLRGDKVTLERLDEHEARIVFDSIYFALYRRTGHLRRQVSEQDYRRIFETIWTDRAVAAGWSAEYACQGSKVVLRLTRPGAAGH